jgi:hypothetical protein
MAVLHIVQGGIDNGDKKQLERAARKNLSVPSWIVPKSAAVGDEVVIYVSGYGFFAAAKIKTRAKQRVDWKNRYGAGLNLIKLIDPAISIGAIQRHIPKLTWARYPRSITTPPPEVASQIRKLISSANRWSVGVIFRWVGSTEPIAISLRLSFDRKLYRWQGFYDEIDLV